MGRVPRVAVAQPITHLWERHREILRRLVAGDRQVDIAHSLDMTEARLSVICNSPAFQHELRRLSAGADASAMDVNARIQELSHDAITIMENAILDRAGSVPIKLKVDVAKDVLDRAGFGAVRKLQVTDVHLTKDDIEDLKRRRAGSNEPAGSACDGMSHISIDVSRNAIIDIGYESCEATGASAC